MRAFMLTGDEKSTLVDLADAGIGRTGDEELAS
jgi:hypothetical protein